MQRIASFALALGFAGIAAAQSADIAAVARLTGEARTKALVEGAKKEGEVMVYHSTQASDLKPVFDAFTAKYGVAVKDWRSSSENVVQRVVSEARAGRRDVDFVENNAPEMEALRREKLLLPMESPHHADLRPGTVPANKTWATSTIDVFVQAYNTEKVKREELPKSFDDLADPRWKGRLGIEAEDLAWFGTLLEAMGEDKGRRLFDRIVATNGISVRKGHTLLANLVASGEIPLALTVYGYKPEQLKKRGENIDWIALEPTLAQLHAVTVMSNASHPYAAMLLYDFFLGEGQALLAKKEFMPASTKVPSKFSGLKLRFIDAAESIDKEVPWTKQYEELIVKRSR